MEKILAVIDTGVNLNHPIFEGKDIICYQVMDDGYIYIREKNNCDLLGHGTGVCGIIIKECPSIKMYVYRVFESEYITTEEKIFYALKHIEKTNICSVIHMSLGINYFSTKLEEECKHLKDMGKVIIAAFDNTGAISYPAAFPCTLGVDIDTRCSKRKGYHYYENNIVSIGVMGGIFRVANLEGTYSLNQGSSFAAAFFTGYIMNMCEKSENHKELIERIINNATNVVDTKRKILDIDEKMPFEIKGQYYFLIIKKCMH